ncbi:hypothetical protein DIJ64_11135 [Mycobacterium leprae]|uniref:Uncharacterized protein n=1 Tax=Mycobacterium leprae TaxID=1769 RepID=A0AAD0KT06_MYCLR|nr:hypothetical protein DIJ64_11135 [Mycobacterium leprae]OAR20780.1 hypothetical protein A8144_01875 [Mycobacterium leprae 3125609]OAX71983.1 hypothetical protein A3216_01950 [Mycobacterium leprae 7935681]
MRISRNSTKRGKHQPTIDEVQPKSGYMQSDADAVKDCDWTAASAKSSLIVSTTIADGLAPTNQ